MGTWWPPQGQVALRRGPQGPASLRPGALLLGWGSASLPQLRTPRIKVAGKRWGRHGARRDQGSLPGRQATLSPQPDSSTGHLGTLFWDRHWASLFPITAL
jgi:hypothetical protein